MITEIAYPDAKLPGGALEEGHGVFEFEADFARDFRCIPMVVRFKLDRVGIKLSLKQWKKIGYANRCALTALPCNRERDASGYRRTLVQMVEESASGPIVDLQPDLAPLWACSRRVPDDVVAQADRTGIAPPKPEQWAGLNMLQRFALLKLARSNHDNHNFEPAMREFGLLPN